MTPRTLALYLPQFHPVPENDAWWGKGFTEWTNVTKARPLFAGHTQPHLPTDMGFYDLRVPEVREAQAALAREYGIHGFCYYHYWFNGRRLLERPFNEVLASGRPDFPFCLCWANEPWSRRWLGEERDVLMPQSYSAEDDQAHAAWLTRAFADPRYVKEDGRALFLIYRPLDHPEPARLVRALRQAAGRHGLASPYVVGVDAHRPGFDYREVGLDSTMRFAPQLGRLPMAFDDRRRWPRLWANLRQGIRDMHLRVYDEPALRALSEAEAPAHPHLPCVFVGWDNTARRGKRGIILRGGGPQVFGAALRRQLAAWRASQPEVPYFFLNAWNEWAEGNHLEPDQQHGRAYLEQVRAALGEAAALAGRTA